MLEINRQLRLTSDQYFQEETTKTQIVLHHTVGGSAESTFNYWQQTSERVGTSYIVDRDGTIYEIFDPIYWAHHLGLKVAKNGIYNRDSIGIELASEGALIRKGDFLYAFDGNKKFCHIDEIDKYVDFGEEWRGYRYFDVYDPQQYSSLVDLAKHLLEKFEIEQKLSMTCEFDEDFYEFKGIIAHSNVRIDKTDLHPLFDWNSFRRDIEKISNDI